MPGVLMSRKTRPLRSRTVCRNVAQGGDAFVGGRRRRRRAKAVQGQLVVKKILEVAAAVQEPLHAVVVEEHDPPVARPAKVDLHGGAAEIERDADGGEAVRRGKRRRAGVNEENAARPPPGDFRMAGTSARRSSPAATPPPDRPPSPRALRPPPACNMRESATAKGF